MTSLQSRVADVIDATVTQMRSATGYRAPSDLSSTGFPVFDGPEIWNYNLQASTGYLIIGVAGVGDETPEPSSTSDFTAGPIGPPRSRDEVGVITCLAGYGVADYSDGAASTCRRAAMGIVADVADLCRDDPSLGLDSSGVVGGIRTRTWVTAGAMNQYRMPDSTVCDWLFTLTFTARL